MNSTKVIFFVKIPNTSPSFGRQHKADSPPGRMLRLLQRTVRHGAYRPSGLRRSNPAPAPLRPESARDPNRHKRRTASTVRSGHAVRPGQANRVRIAPGIRDFPDQPWPEHGKATVTSATISTGRLPPQPALAASEHVPDQKGDEPDDGGAAGFLYPAGRKPRPPERLPPADSHAGTFVYISVRFVSSR